MSGRVWFVGAGPGAADLLTLRAARVLGEADVIVWARSLVDPEVLEHARPEAELVAVRRQDLRRRARDLPSRRRRGPRRRARALRRPDALRHAHEQLRACRELGLECEIVPGVSSLGAAAAALGQELTIPDVSPVADPHPPRAADVDAAERGAGRVRRARHDDGAVPLGAPPARAAGRPDRGRLRGGHALRRRLQGELAGRDRDPLPARASSASASARRRSRPRRSCSSAPRSAARERRPSHVYDPGYGHRYRPLGRAGPATEEAVPEIRRCSGVLGRRACRPGTEALLAGADVVAGGRAVLDALAPADGAPGRPRQGPRGDARDARARARPRRACSRPAIPASSASSARSRAIGARSTCTRRRRRWRSRSRGSGCRGTTRSSSPPTAATRAPAINTALRHPKVAILTDAQRRRAIVDALARPPRDRRRGARHARRAPAPREPPFAEPNVVIVHEPTAERPLAAARRPAGRSRRTRSSTAPA